jgi:hypothetical protein
MTPLAYIAALAVPSLAWLAALCCGFPRHRDAAEGDGATNGMFVIRIPADVGYYGGDRAVRAAAYLQERIEQILKWAMVLMAGNEVAIVTFLATGDAFTATVVGFTGGVLAWAVRNAAPIRRQREYVGHEAEIQHVERYSPIRQRGYRASEIGRMSPRPGSKYGTIFLGHDIAAGLGRAAPVARFMLRLTSPALNRFIKEPTMTDPTPTPTPKPEPEGDETSVLPKKPKPKPGGEE